MTDGRKNNGNKGHSTKAKGIDKRKNPYKGIIHETITEDKLRNVLNMLYKKAITKKDIKASQIILEYTLVKPKQTIDINAQDLLRPFFKDNPLT